ncbi:MAG: T9SS type A sorting domain-containing protein [Prolixibacteraceae bacterium]|nr:T9SS type A sorting domain-containing protein [Prolixibacteraceae bacterium]
MKTLAFIFALIFTAICAFGQNYKSFQFENAQWNVYLEYSMSESPTDTTVLRYFVDGDTILDQNTYHRLCREMGDLSDPVFEAVGGIREENKVVCFFGNDCLWFPHEEELILYDFNKEIGDTVFHDDTFYSVIEDIDSIEIGGEYRKRYKINSNNVYSFGDEEYWVEGIGSIKNGLLGHITLIPTCCYHYWEHICYKENDEVLYLNPRYDDCFPGFLLGTDKQFEIESEIKMYPNPTDDKLNVELLTDIKNVMIKIFDIKGNILLQNELADKKSTISLPVSHRVMKVVLFDSKGGIIKSETIMKK